MPLGPEPIGDSVAASNSATAPGALTFLTSFTCPPGGGGMYHWHFEVWYGATAGAANDMALDFNGSNIYIFRIDAVALSNLPVVLDMVHKMNPGDFVGIVSVAGAAGVYNASQVITKIRAL